MRFNVRINDYIIPTAIGVASFTVGVGVGWFLASRRRSVEVETFYNKEEWDIQLGDSNDSPLQEWVDNDQERHNDISSGSDIHSSEVLLDNASGADQFYLDFESGEHALDLGDETPIAHENRSEKPEHIYNAFRGYEGDDDWDWPTELEYRKNHPDGPYILTSAEYGNDEMDFTHSSLDYYAGDDVLCYEDDTPIHNYVKDFGELKFGHGCPENPDIVHVRNHRLGGEWEICRHPGHYVVEVLGAELEHSRKPKKGKQHPKFKLDY